MKARLAIGALLACLLLAACRGEALPPGTVASVNGELISLHSLQALLDSRSAALGVPPRPSVSEMRAKYRDALAILIAHALARQELEERGLAPRPEDLTEAISQIKEDYGAESLEGYLADASLREDDWRQLMRDHLALQTFTERVLLPSIRIPLPEVKAYYEEHRGELALPRSLRVCHAAAESAEALEAWCAGLGAADFVPGPLAQCVDITPGDAPDPWREDIKKLKPGACGRIIEQQGQWRVLGLVGRSQPRAPELSEIYGLIEGILLERKKTDAFNHWLERKAAASRILVNPELFPAGE